MAHIRYKPTIFSAIQLCKSIRIATTLPLKGQCPSALCGAKDQHRCISIIAISYMQYHINPVLSPLFMPFTIDVFLPLSTSFPSFHTTIIKSYFSVPLTLPRPSNINKQCQRPSSFFPLHRPALH